MQPMLGDHAEILKTFVSQTNLTRAFEFALRDRSKMDFFYDPFEIDFVQKNKESVIQGLSEELAAIDEFQIRPAFAYFLPKNDLCFRRMIYLPFKDLVVKYAFVSVAADMLDGGLYRNSFADRRAKGEDAQQMLFEPFHNVAWPRFCGWQRAQIGTFGVLLKSDISAYYDSISHEHLVDAFAQALGIPLNSKLMLWFATLIRPNVISYSSDRSRTAAVEQLRQGLCTGSTVEGHLSNLYLAESDATMQRYCEIRNIAYGRYKDDIRIFANSKQEAKDALLLLQQCLLTKGLNLNAHKTEFAASKDDMERLISKDDYYYGYEESEDGETQAPPLMRAIDRPFEHNDGASITLPLKNASDAKRFCKFLSKHFNLAGRQDMHVKELGRILVSFPGCSKHACWLLVQTAVYTSCTKEANAVARSEIIERLKDPEVSAYARYRLLHHLTKQRSDGGRYIERLNVSELSALDQITTLLIEEPSIEQIIGALYYKYVRGADRAGLEDLLQERAPKPLTLPLQNLLLSLGSPRRLPSLVSTSPRVLPDDDEYDAEEDHY